MHYRTKKSDLVDAICWRHYGEQSGAVEVVLEANPGLADIGPVLPAGIIIELPRVASGRSGTPDG